jgi:hypothetical protein
MRTLSRHLPDAKESESTLAQRIAGIIFLIMFVGFIFALPYFLLRSLSSEIILFSCFGAIMVPACLFAFHRQKTAFEKLMAPRASENICTFRRAFDLRRVDPWIVRAVYEEVIDAMIAGMGKTKCAIRASDRLVEDLLIDDEELGDTAKTIAERAGYDFTDTKKNPLYGKVITVEDLVMFFTHQRKLRMEDGISPKGAE